MGWGDEIQTTGLVKKAKERHPDKNILVGDGSRIFWSEVFDGNPKIGREITPNSVWVRSYPGFRPHSTPVPGGWKFHENYKVVPGEIYPKDKYDLSGFVYIEPNVKPEYGLNKDWGFDRWQEVVDSLPHVRWIQPPGKRLRGVEQIDTESFMDACSLLKRAFLFVGTESGLQHAAAALGIPGVIVFTGFTSHKNFGYDFHLNLQAPVKPCGKLAPCSHCRKAAEWVKPEMVVEGVIQALSKASDV